MFEINSRSKKLYIPWVIMFTTTLKEGKHTIVLRMSAEKNKESIGNACQIYYFTINGGKSKFN